MGWARVKSTGLVALVIVGVAGVARAAGPMQGPRTAEELARAGAQHSDPRSPAALCSNPGAMAGLRGLQLQVEGNLLVDARTYTPPGGSALRNQAAPTVSPSLFASYNLASVDVPSVTLGLGWFAPPQVNRSWAATVQDAARYVEITGSEARRDLAAGLGYALPWLGFRLGATALITQLSVQHSLDVQMSGVDVPLGLQVSEGTVIGGVVSASANPWPWLVLAASYQFAQDARLTGRANLPALAALQGNQVDVGLQLPGIAWGSVQLRDPQDRYDIELNVVWENWQRSQRVRVIPDNIKFSGNAVPEVDVNYAWHNAGSLRLGGRYRLPVDRAVTVHAGVFVETSAVDDAALSVAAFAPSGWGLGAGARVGLFASTWAEAAAGLRAVVPATVTQSHVYGGTLQGLTPGRGPVAGTGRYGGVQAVFALALGATLDI